MKYASELDALNFVKRVVTVGDDVLNVEEYCSSLFGGNWKECFTDGTRKQFGNTAYYYDKNKDMFICPQPFNSWFLNENNDWEPPVAFPQDENSKVPGEDYRFIRIWDEENKRWIGKDKKNNSQNYVWDPSNLNFNLI